MKKKFTITALLILMAFIGFAQECPTSFKRNNGNGICPSGAEVQMYFAVCPDTIPQIDSIYASGVNTNITQLNVDASKCATRGYISYCISSDIPPVHAITVYFSTATTTGNNHTVCTVTDTVPSGGPLPVLLSNFDVQRQSANTVTANWKTDQENNSDRFELQRSSNNSAFETVGTVLTQNLNSSIAQFYSFTDQNNLEGVSLYRLKMIDKDIFFRFSSIKSVKGTSGTSDFIIYPNPSTGNAKISISDMSEPTKVMIFDNSGRLIKQTGFTNSNSVDINNLQKGGYIIKVTGEKTGASSVKKFTVIN